MKIAQKMNGRGSVLVFGLIVLFVIMVMALGVASVTVIERKMSGATGKSVLAFQIADGGVELVLKKLNKDTPAPSTIEDLKITGSGTCSGGKITDYIGSGNSKKFEVTFKDSNGDFLVCADSVFRISRVKSAGIYGDTTRAVETEVPVRAELLLHNNGLDGSTTFTDSSPLNNEVNRNGDVAIKTSQFKFGGASAYFDGSGDYLSVSDSDDWDFGDGDFTIDMWVRVESGGDSCKGILTTYADGLYSGWGIWACSGKFTFSANLGGVSVWEVALSDSADYNVDTWYHLAVVRDGDDWTLYKDGNSVDSTNESGSISDSGVDLEIGESYSLYEYKGYIDELRVSKGIAVWKADFTPPISEY